MSDRLTYLQIAMGLQCISDAGDLVAAAKIIEAYVGNPEPSGGGVVCKTNADGTKEYVQLVAGDESADGKV